MDLGDVFLPALAALTFVGDTVDEEEASADLLLGGRIDEPVTQHGDHGVRGAGLILGDGVALETKPAGCQSSLWKLASSRWHVVFPLQGWTPL